jgi:dihydrofolate synthase/folylpolyglutamate synthase
MTFSQKIDQLLHEKIGYEHFNPDLSTLRIALNTWGLLKLAPNCKVVTIAGTNGKGETTRTLAHMLQQSNVSFAQWTSPHIFKVCERMVFNGIEVKEDELLALIQKFLTLHQKLEVSLSYYEFLFAVFLKLVQDKRPEYLLLEVGLGGRLDAVNILNADLVLLTSIGRDHQEFLGNRLENIIKEKLGVTRKGGHLISTLELKYLRQIVDKYTASSKINWVDLFERDLDPKLSFSKRNQQLALSAYRFLTGKSSVLEMPEIGKAKRVEFDWTHGKVHYLGFGSHNPDGLRKLVQFLSQENYNNFDTLVVSFSKRKQKDIQSMLKMLMGLRVTSIHLVSFDHPKALDAKSLKTQALALEKLEQFEQVEFIDDIPKLIHKLSITPKIQNVLVCGSYYFLGQFRSYFQGLGEE